MGFPALPANCQGQCSGVSAEKNPCNPTGGLILSLFTNMQQQFIENSMQGHKSLDEREHAHVDEE